MHRLPKFSQFIKSAVPCGLSVVVSLAVLVVFTAMASAETVTKNYPADVIFENGQKASNPGNCSAAVFAQWDHIDDTLSATANYTVNDKPQSLAFSPPWDDTFDWVYLYHAPGGVHRGNIGLSWKAGPIPDDCSSMTTKHKEMYSTVATVDLTFDKVKPPKIKQLPGIGNWLRSGQVAIATVKCPKKGAFCHTVPVEPIKITVGGSELEVLVRVPKSIRPGKTRKVTLKLHRPVDRLKFKGEIRTPHVTITASKSYATATKTIKRSISYED